MTALAILAAFWLGGILGFLTAALMAAASRDDDIHDRN